ncbi:uncharacterized protein LOC103961600 [Pyrus x bretschneideri]|uniref:uncharacterized protein LOC103961600 n=1 Tax=Pyrus x bretschneideri TaxID=225117 RepID=UPI00202F18DA|nr:uncharacterized protein LOC103961600 [Pyrus x bretschneideri]
MINNYQDAMAICREHGHPDLFITFTCNVKWPEIMGEIAKKSGFKPEDRPDIISRIFKMKLDDMLDFIKSGKPFGEVEASTGKTFLWDAIISRLRSEGKIVLAVASSGIASLLLPDEQCSHCKVEIESNICSMSETKVCNKVLKSSFNINKGTYTRIIGYTLNTKAYTTMYTNIKKSLQTSKDSSKIFVDGRNYRGDYLLEI